VSSRDSFLLLFCQGTYTSSDSSFTNQLDLLVDAFGPSRSGVGLETVNASTEERLPLDEVSHLSKHFFFDESLGHLEI
jgi:hypothetical protein